MRSEKYKRTCRMNNNNKNTNVKMGAKQRLRALLIDHVIPIKILELFKWILIDIYRLSKSENKEPHLFGIKCVVGMYGCGKTVTMTQLANNLREKYGNDIYIISNYGLSIQDKPFKTIEDLTMRYDKNTIFLWDEVQNIFPATEKNFPRNVRETLSLCRKGKGKLIYWSSQDHELVHKTIRRLTIEYYEVRTFINRLTKVRVYNPYDYQAMFENNDVEKKVKIHPKKRFSFIQTDNLRNQYNSYGYDNGEKIELI